MTATTHSRPGPVLAEVRAAPTARRRVRVVGGVRPPLRWWHARLVLGATIGGAMAGALLGVVQGYLALGLVPMRLLEAYGAAAGFGASVGLLLGLGLSLAVGLVDRHLRSPAVPSRRTWVRYRRD